MFTVEFFETEDGKQPVAEFLDSLEPKMSAKMVGLMEILEEKGTELRLPYSEHLEDGIFELRCKLGSNITRALYFFFANKTIVITNGFVKKTQKTPPNQIKLAKKKKKRVDKEERRQDMNLSEYKKTRMKDVEFKQAYEEIQPEMNIIRAIIDARISNNLTQKELAEKTGIAQAEISKIENGTRNPSIKLLQRLADGMDMVLNISFSPKQNIIK